ncbi:hypothetical protein [Nocardia salmonicida]|uniref:hypothetical protein n=1 Tax=Nocardia salmonicida TaxID=53431 RepID=UPI0033DAF670
MSTPTPPPSSTPPSSTPSSSPPLAAPQTPWWKNPAVISVAGLIGAAAAVLALFRDTIDFKLGSKPDAPSTSMVSTANPVPAPDVNGYGWGPLRELYTIKEPSPTAVFNSINDNPVHGSDVNFVGCRIDGDPNTMYRDEVAIPDDTTISVDVWIDNSSVRADQAIKGARMDLRMSSDSIVNPAINVHLSGTNVIEVYNGCKILTMKPAQLSYIPGSASLRIYDTPPIKIDDAVVRGDKLLPGVRGKAEGVIGGDDTYYGYIKFLVKVYVH